MIDPIMSYEIRPEAKAKLPFPFEEARRVNDLLLELSADPTTPAEALAELRLQQQELLGGVAKPARGLLPGTIVPAHRRGSWKEELEKRAKARFSGGSKQKPASDPILNNRAERRAWAAMTRGQ